MKLVLVIAFLVGAFNRLSIGGVLTKHDERPDLYDKDTKPVAYLSNNKDNSRVFGGLELDPINIVHFIAGLDIIQKDGKKIWCGGTLISRRYVLTAAHCLEDAVKATVILGLYDRSLASEPTRLTQTVLKGNFIIHSEFDDDTLENDIALIKLNQVVTPVPGEIEIAILADETYQVEEDVIYAVFGWGYFNSNYILASRLRFSFDLTISNEICRETYGKLIRSTNVCMDSRNGRTACIGDDGGPLLSPPTMSGAITQIGIVSFGLNEGCGRYFPTVFTRVSKYAKWIRKNSDL